MKTTPLILVASTLISCVTQPGFSQNTYRPVRVIQTGSGAPPGTYIGGGTMSQSAQGTPAGVGGEQFKGVLPNVPMGTVIGTANDRVGSHRVNGSASAAQIEQPRNGLQPTRMGAAIGMPSDSVGRSGVNAASSMRNGLQPTRHGAVVAMPGDGMRSDIPGTPMYREQVMKRLRNSNNQRPMQTSPQNQQNAQQQPATYGDSYDGKPKRNY